MPLLSKLLIPFDSDAGGTEPGASRCRRRLTAEIPCIGKRTGGAIGQYPQ
jgi:hypothetical protein